MKYRGIRMCTVADEPSYRIYQNDVIKLENDKSELTELIICIKKENHY